MGSSSYRRLGRRDPADVAVAARIAELERAAAAGDGAAPGPAVAPPPAAPPAAAPQTAAAAAAAPPPDRDPAPVLPGAADDAAFLAWLERR